MNKIKSQIIEKVGLFFARHVIIPREFVKHVPQNHLMTETEWRNLGIQQSPGWKHYLVHTPGLF